MNENILKLAKSKRRTYDFGFKKKCIVCEKDHKHHIHGHNQTVCRDGTVLCSRQPYDRMWYVLWEDVLKIIDEVSRKARKDERKKFVKLLEDKIPLIHILHKNCGADGHFNTEGISCNRVREACAILGEIIVKLEEMNKNE